MTALVLQVTEAGRAAVVNAPNTGTQVVLVSQIGVTEQAFTAATDGSDTALPGELKRLATVAGEVVAADTIHVSVTDASEDDYDLRGFALYLDDGTLFALYGQAEPIMGKSAAAMLLLAVDAIFQTLDVAAITFGATDFALPQATTERSGTVELATSAETITGTDGSRAVTPAALKAASDERFGAGAPSPFVKGLLTQATDVSTRAALGIKSAAEHDAAEFLSIKWVAKGDGDALVAGDRVIPDNAIAAATLTLPAAPQDGDAIEWRQGAVSFEANAVIFARNGKTIMGLAEDMTVDTDAAGGSLVWRQALNTWRVYATNTAGTV